MVHPHTIVRERTNSKAEQSMSKHDDAICGFSGTLPWKDGSSMPRESDSSGSKTFKEFCH